MIDPAAVVAASRILDDELDRVEAVASRFRGDSEIVLGYRADGTPQSISPDMEEALAIEPLWAAEVTDGPSTRRSAPPCGASATTTTSPSWLRGSRGRCPAPGAVPGWRSVDLDAVGPT